MKVEIDGHSIKLTPETIQDGMDIMRLQTESKGENPHGWIFAEVITLGVTGETMPTPYLLIS